MVREMKSRKLKETVGIVLCIGFVCFLTLTGCQQTGTATNKTELSEDDTAEESSATEERKPVLTEDEIFKIAALHSKTSDMQQIVTKPISLKNENGTTYYEVEFSVGQKEYEYEIDAYTGEVIAYDYEDKEPRDDMTGTPITLEEAKHIALNWAVVGEAECVFTKEDYFEEKVPAVFELAFLFKEKEYEFEILAADGTVIECSMEPAEIRASEPRRVKE